MSTMTETRILPRFGALTLDPAVNPGVLDTATWDPAAAIAAAQGLGERWSLAQQAIRAGRSFSDPALQVPLAAAVVQPATIYALATLADGQRLIAHFGAANGSTFGKPIAEFALAGGQTVRFHPASAEQINRYCRELKPRNAPRALGAIPRLGIGVRMTTAVWPGIFAAMSKHGFAANAVQNSVRELNLLDDLVAGRPPIRNYACGFGTIDSGYTGSTFEGLWLAGTLAALEYDGPLAWGADADHIQPKRDDPSLDRPQRVIDAARNYTFFTLDVSDVLDYQALDQGVTPAALARKYEAALAITGRLSQYIARVNGGQAVDLELSIDEHPPEVPAFACLTSEAELAFVLGRIRELGLPVTHIAPNLGIEKGLDYRHPSGLAGLEERTRAQSRLAEAAGVMLDIHSADDLGPATREALHRATGGRIHYKISPSLQILFAQTLRDHDPALFARWEEDASAYARREAAAGSAFAAQCLAAAQAADPVKHPVFHNFSFAYLGRRIDGGFPNRPAFYRLSSAFFRDYAGRVEHRLAQLARELF